MPAGQHLFDDLTHPHVGALLEALDETDDRHPRTQFLAEFAKHAPEPV